MLSRWFVVVMLVGACGGPRVVSALPHVASASNERTPLLHVTLDATSAHLPLAVNGSNIAYGDVDRALAMSVERAVAELDANLTRKSARPLELCIELVEAHAEYEQGRLLVRLGARATLRERTGNVYLAQTHAHANASAFTPPDRGGKVVLDTTDTLASELSGWLSGMDLR